MDNTDKKLLKALQTKREKVARMERELERERRKVELLERVLGDHQWTLPILESHA